MTKLTLKRILSALIAAQLSAPTSLFANDTEYELTEKLKNSPHYVLTSENTNLEKGLMSTTSVENVSPESIETILNQLPDNTNKEILVSTDNQTVVEKTTRWANLKNKTARFILLGKKTKATINNIPRNLLNAARRDKVGLMVTIINTTYDTILWVHACDMTIQQKTGIILFNLLMTLTFNIDKDNWAKLTKKVDGRIIHFLDKFNLIKNKHDEKSAGVLLSNFVAGASLGILVQATRLSIISMDQLAYAATSANFWGVAVLFGVINSFSSFSWSQQMHQIDEIKNPVAKNIARRTTEIRALIMGQLAPSAKVLHPTESNLMPWISLVGNGLLGMLVFFKSDKIVDFVEHHKIFQKIQESYNKMDEKIESYLIPIFGRIIRSCNSIHHSNILNPHLSEAASN